MTTEQATALILKDQAGEYYVLPQAVLERGRVPAEARAALEAHVPALQAIGTADDDTQGHVDGTEAFIAISGTVPVGLGYLLSLAFPGDAYLYGVIQEAIDRNDRRTR